MDKTIKINLGGTLFQIDEEAYKILRGYLQDITNRLRNAPGAAETVEDIELRIAEIFQSQGASAGIISKENVEAMMIIIGKPEDFETEIEDNKVHEPEFRSYTAKKLYRNPDDQIIGGVCGGLGAFLNIEPVWVRILFILFTCFFGIGFFVYIALWIALPSATSDLRKREMYGTDDYMAFLKKSHAPRSASQGSPSPGSRVGSALNEVFLSLGRVIFIFVRILLIVFGICLVLTGFIALIIFVMVFFFKYPGYFSTTPHGINLFYFPDFLNYVVNPAIAPWILALSFIVILLPLLAMIYWGVKMIFWFRAKDGIISLAGLVAWVMCIAALSILLFNEGISFAETAKSVTGEIIEKAPKDIYVLSGQKVSDLHYDKEIAFDEEDYKIFFIDGNKGFFISTDLNIDRSDDNSVKLSISRRSAGRSRMDARIKAEGIIYKYKILGDTIRLDEYFTLPAGSKWSADDVRVSLYVPEGTVVHLDKTTEDMFRHENFRKNEWDRSDGSSEMEYAGSDIVNPSWIMTEEGLKKRSSIYK
ncbi:MAG TPA: PspC domain-containing protein [Bacteroidales bacterium]|nr:PspC domain-containing protein [Bacteroidales bacterium]